MNVYFNQNFWDKRQNGDVGIPQKVNWNFLYDSKQYYIPTIYKFSYGVTIDIISLMDNKIINSFIEKYEHKINDMTEEDRLFLEDILPFKDLPIKNIYINDELTMNNSGCSSFYISCSNKYENENNQLIEMKNEYDFLRGNDISFQCKRIHVKFNNNPDKEIITLKLTTSKTEYIIPIKKHFKIDLQMSEEEYEQEFTHPLTNKTYYLYIYDVKKYNARETFPQFEENNPYYYAGFNYELAPELQGDERLFLDEIKQVDEENQTCASSAASIGIIGGSDQAINLYTKGEKNLGKHGYPVNHIFTRMYFKNLKEIEMSIVGIYKEKLTEQTIMLNL